MLVHLCLKLLRITRSETETAANTRQLTDVGQDREINHCQLLKSTMRHIQNKNAPKQEPRKSGKGLNT